MSIVQMVNALVAQSEGATSLPDVADRICRELLSYCMQEGCSDLHFNPQPGDVVAVLTRRYGVLEEVCRIPLRVYRYVDSWIRGKTGVPKRDKRNWDGRLHFRAGSHQYYSFRVAISYTPIGDTSKITLRALDADLGETELEALGFSDEDVVQIKGVLNLATGIVLVSGPTGSGKTTTLYSALKYVKRDRHVVSIEDPVEHPIDGITQLEVIPEVVTFYDHLKAALRHDPDVIMIGELRDSETARTAVSAALSGHLVLGTVHANSALVSILRMADLGADLYDLSFSLRAVLAQRLLPRLCPYCLSEYPTPDWINVQLESRGYAPVPFGFKARGCEDCRYMGVSGRELIYELFVITPEDQNVIYEVLKKQEPFEQAVMGYFKSSGKRVRSMLDVALTKVREGKVSIEDVARYCL